MPKMKTKRSAAKRFKKTGTGKITMRKSKMKHLLEHESSNKKRDRSGSTLVSKSDAQRIQAMMPYA